MIYSPEADTSRELARMADLKERSPPVRFMGIVTTPTLSRTVTLKMEILGTTLLILIELSVQFEN